MKIRLAKSTKICLIFEEGLRVEKPAKDEDENGYFDDTYFEELIEITNKFYEVVGGLIWCDIDSHKDLYGEFDKFLDEIRESEITS